MYNDIFILKFYTIFLIIKKIHVHYRKIGSTDKQERENIKCA